MSRLRFAIWKKVAVSFHDFWQDVAQRRALRASRKAMREAAKRYEREGLRHCRICGGLLHDERDH